MFGACKCCAEKERRIEDLQSQINFLRELVRPPELNASLPLVDLERDAILSGSQDVMEIKANPTDDDDAIQREASALLAGTYS